MFIDASALCAILLNEPDAPMMLKALEGARGKPIISPVVRVETMLRIARDFADQRNSPNVGEDDFEKAKEHVGALLEAIGVREMHITESMGKAAIEALKKYGKVAGHPAKLNMGDAFAYAVAKAYHAPLLYKGDDFSKTDLA
jgi:ribonuclease VapC